MSFAAVIRTMDRVVSFIGVHAVLRLGIAVLALGLLAFTSNRIPTVTRDEPMSHPTHATTVDASARDLVPGDSFDQLVDIEPSGYAPSVHVVSLSIRARTSSLLTADKR